MTRNSGRGHFRARVPGKAQTCVCQIMTSTGQGLAVRFCVIKSEPSQSVQAVLVLDMPFTLALGPCFQGLASCARPSALIHINHRVVYDVKVLSLIVFSSPPIPTTSPVQSGDCRWPYQGNLN